MKFTEVRILKRDFSVKSHHYFCINKKNVLSFIIKIPLSRGFTIHQFFSILKNKSVMKILKSIGLVLVLSAISFQSATAQNAPAMDKMATDKMKADSKMAADKMKADDKMATDKMGSGEKMATDKMGSGDKMKSHKKRTKKHKKASADNMSADKMKMEKH
jgi:hypothetical protein